MLLVSWLSSARLDDKEYQVVEMFAGVSRVAAYSRALGLSAVALDVDFDRATERPGAMDLTSSSGFALLALDNCQKESYWEMKPVDLPCSTTLSA